MQPLFAVPTEAAVPLHVVEESTCQDWIASQPAAIAAWCDLNGFSAAWGQVLCIADPAGGLQMALLGAGSPATRQRKRFVLAAAATKLPKGIYRLAAPLPQDLSLDAECFGWLMSHYAFDRYAPAKGAGAQLIAPEGIDRDLIEQQAAAECLTRDLINTPAQDMGPADLEAAATRLADEFGASHTVIEGDTLLAENFPMIHAVGRASDRAPRLIDLNWGESGPLLTLVGKGVCFDTGGLNLKPGASMGLMKKDMGGAAHVLGLARAIMSAGLALRLRVLIPAVENAVSGNAFRPGDILTSRKGLSVEINNTDAEGRLVLADALALACDAKPDLVISMATLTGAARVAVGPDLAPFYAQNADDAQSLRAAATKQADPVWELPFHAPYEDMIEPGIADLDNAPSGGMAGSITAALFLRRFVDDGQRYMHFDIYGWNPSAQPGRSKGGTGQGLRAIYHALPALLGLAQ